MEDPKILKKMRLFHDFTGAELIQVSSVIRSAECRKGKTLIEEGSRSGSVFLVKKGELKVTHVIRGKRRELGTFCAGDHFGELSFIDNKPRSASIYATQDSELLILTRKAFEKLLDSPQIQIKLMNALLLDLSAKLRQRHDKLDFDLSDLLPVSVFETDPRGNLTFTNRTALEWFGYTQKDFEKGMNVLRMVAPAERDRAGRNLRRALKAEDLRPEEYLALRKDGSTFPVLVHADPIFRGKKPVGLRGTVVDITERKRTEEILRESEERYRIMAETASDAIITIDEDSRMVFVNPATRKVFGYQERELIGKRITMLMPALLRPLHRASFQKYQRTGKKHIPWHGVELPGLDKSGRTISLEISFGEYVKEGKRFFTGIIRDISKRKEAEEEIRTLQKAVETMKIGVSITDVKGRLLYCNRAEAQMHGYHVNELIGKDARIFAPRELWKPLTLRQLGRITNKSRESINKRKDGTTFPVQMISNVVKDHEQRPICVVTSCEDITERKRMEDALHKAQRDLEQRVRTRTAELSDSEKRYRLLFEEYRDLIETMHEFVAELSPNGDFQFVNRPFSESSGYKVEELIGRNFFSFVHPDDLDSTVGHCRTLQETRKPIRNCEYRFRKKDGSYLWLITNGDPVYDASGLMQSILQVSFDVTENKQAEERNRDLAERLRKAEMMESMGKLVSGVAHEVRNPLNAIHATAEAMEQDLGEDPEHKPALKMIRSQVTRLSILMRDLLELGRPVPASGMSRESLPVLCHAAVDLWKQTNRTETHSVQMLFPPDLSYPVYVDATRMQQVLMNLLDNAAQHSPAGSEIDIGLQEKNGCFVIRVTDQGRGVTEQDRTRLFEPFFTTRRGGTGLGLSLVKHFVEAHGGAVTLFNNEPPPGCTVEVKLPVCPGEEEV